MYKIYFKQAVEMLKQNKFFSIISILGTALAIMMIMAIIVTDGIKNISVAPESNRDRTAYLSFQTVKDTANGNYNTNSGSISYEIVKNYIPLIKAPELISIQGGSYGSAIIGTEGTTETVSAAVKYTDPSYWKIFTHTFREGKPFSEEEFLSGIRNTVISESMARKIFKGEKALGQTITIDIQNYKVIGIVKDVSPIFTKASSDIWAPYTSLDQPENKGYTVVMLIKNKKELAAIREEMKNIEKKFNTDHINKSLEFRGLETQKMLSMDVKGNNENEINEFIKVQTRKTWFILIIIMLIPAINLSGLNLSRIRKRTPEIGVRKAFGAKKHIILTQILWENLITSFIGGVLGLILSVFVVLQLKNWLLGIPSDSAIPLNTIISIPVILAVFTACIIINILSAAIPAYRASRMTIVNSITNNDKTP